jgi:hypothetical protein
MGITEGTNAIILLDFSKQKGIMSEGSSRDIITATLLLVLRGQL